MTQYIANNWLNLLEAACTEIPTDQLDIIIDQSGGAPLLSSVRSIDPPMRWKSLFNGQPEASAMDLAPLLVRIDLAEPLQKRWLLGLLHDRAEQQQLLALASLWSFDELAAYLSQCLNARYGGQSALLRYYDPRLFPLLFSHVLEPQQQTQLLRPAVFWSWLDRNGVPQCLLGKGGPAESAASFSAIELSDDQRETLGCASDATVLLASPEAALIPGSSAEQRFQACYAAMLDATRVDLLLENQRRAHVFDRMTSTNPTLLRAASAQGREPHA
ncbi:hypothetical protein D9M70_438360 [compost metagenome]